LTHAGDYDAIRVAAQMTEFDLPDTAISSVSLLPAVESGIITTYTNWESITVVEQVLLRSAVVCLTAAAAVSREMEKERGMEYSYTRLRKELVENLKNQGAESLGLIDSFDDAINAQIVTTIFQAYGPERYKRENNDWADVGDIL
jgi:hypothetical protein